LWRINVRLENPRGRHFVYLCSWVRIRF
jgi:hypothetical protein